MTADRNFTLLNNGMFVAHDKMSEIESVSISILVKTGSRFEEERVSGISHLLEHMAFKGTFSRSAKQIAEEFDMIGGHLNAYTSREKTVYYAKVLKENLIDAVDILADIMQHSMFAEEELDKERKVVLQEMAQTQDTPDDIVFDYFQEVAFPTQPMGRPILGYESIIKSLSREEILEYVNSKYHFNNMVISGAGNFDVQQYHALIQEKFVSLPSSSINTCQKSTYVGGESRVEKDLEQVHIVIGFKGLSYHDQSYYTQQIIAMVAGGGMSSRLFQEVREKKGLAYTIYAFSSHYSDTGILGIYSSSSPENINELVDVVILELHKMLDTITDDEVERAKSQLRASLLMGQESSVSRAERLASNLAKYQRYISIPEILSKINTIDAAAVSLLLKQIITSGEKPTVSSIGKNQKLYQYETIVDKLKI